MRPVIVLLVLLIPIASALFNITATASCPGDNLTMVATSSDGAIPVGLELRLVRYYPYSGLSGIAHTDQTGSASITLAKTGDYRIYFNTSAYQDHIDFSYPELCPPPPPNTMDLSVACRNDLLTFNATYDGAPLPDVFIQGQRWSSMTDQDGAAFLPLDPNSTIFVSASRPGFANQSGWFGCQGS